MNSKQLIFHPVTACLITLASLFFLLSLIKTDATIEESNLIVGQLESEVLVLEQSLLELEDRVAAATSSTAREKIIRNELLMQKPGEYVVQIPSLEEINQENSLPEVSKPTSPIQAWKSLILGEGQ